ncbi:MAG TPA: response regulator, partial [Myxococcota bacterium]|nr:response regulator [Myxococcota bacterium]
CCLLTAAESEVDELRSLDAGADAYVRKSEDMGVILARLSALLRHATTALEGLPNEHQPRRILAVDDSVTYLSALGEVLEQEGFTMTLATSGEEALSRLEREGFDVILLDLAMPGLSGTETCRIIKRDPRRREIPLIMLTARDDRDAMIEGINAGADDYIAKSADFEVLKARLRAQLRRKHFEDENHRIREQLVRREAEERHLAALEEKNRELARARDEAERMSQAKSAFLANMSHELRTPLNAIIGFAELLHDRVVTPDMPEHRDFLGDILKSGLHLLQLINDILDLSKVEAGKLEFFPGPIALSQVVGEVTAALRPQAEGKGLTIAADLDPAVERLTLDASRLKQILFNFLSNAVK